ncbi:hypothetical protein LG198_04995 [Methylobacillus arboreus]|uniref:hypothetical protein n=1 Tax=Methylobacillus arboreus TaxID=755170 RepID=UPI001E61AE0E|nr:hypothetical protein [Methylobacillus arboreus]MCB5190079.1 hypothetical protein [Methylobacillus arboreus]
MSLLISALEKAEQGKQQSLKKAEIEDFVFDLGPADETARSGENKQADTAPPEAGQTTANQQAAARLLAAKSATMKLDSRISPFTQGLLLLALLLLIGFGVLWYTSSLTQPEVIVPKPLPLASAPSVVENDMPEAVAEGDDATAQADGLPTMTALTPAPIVLAEPPVRSTPPTSQPVPQVFGEAPRPPENSRVQVSRNRAAATVNQSVLSAYDAFNRGDDALAQQGYRQALQADLRNVDALLGMAAIAARQNRSEDAIGWYKKVLEVEPRNHVAQAAIVDLKGQADPVASESRLKSLISQQPDAAYLHAALGHLYTEQGQWPLAQQAYFQAHHLDAANPEYAFNLAVSLDQMGKQVLALQYYRQTQALLALRESAAVDQAQLAARIQQLQ